MKKNILVLFLLICFLRDVSAQKTTANDAWKFKSVNQVGLLEGESNGAFHLQSVNGFEKNNLLIGVGAGIDYYRFRSVPLFAEGIKYFGKIRNQFFVYADAGIHFVWEKTNKEFNYAEKYHPGFYGGTGVGYKAGFKNGTGLSLSAGYSYKKVIDEGQYGSCPLMLMCTTSLQTDRYNLNRLLFQIGWLF